MMTWSSERIGLSSFIDDQDELRECSDNMTDVASEEQIMERKGLNLTNSESCASNREWRAYMVLAGSFIVILTNLGLINSIGAVQAHVSRNQLKDVSTFGISWVFSIFLCLSYAVGLVTGSVFDKRGALVLLIPSALFMIAGMFGAAFSKSVYQFILSFIAVGISCGLSLTPSVGVINHWFDINRIGTCQGIATSAGSVGGLAFPLLLNHMYSTYGFRDAIITLGCLCFGCLLFGMALIGKKVKRNDMYSPNERTEHVSKWKQVKNNINLFNFGQLKDVKYLLLVIGSFFAELSYVIIVTYYDTYALAQGVTESTAYLLLTVFNASGIPGRFLPAYLSDYIGKYNMLLIMLLGYVLSIFILWFPFGYSHNVLYAFAALCGFFLGLILTMLPICLAEISDVLEFGERYGIVNFFISIGNLFGIPIAAVVIGDESVTNYNHFAIMAAVLSVVGTVFWYASRHAIVGFRLKVKV